MTHEELLQDYLSKRGFTVATATTELLSSAEAYASCYRWYIDVMKVTAENAAIASGVWLQKYALKDSTGLVLEFTPEDMWLRLSSTLAKVEVKTNKISTRSESEWATEFYNTFSDFKYVLGGSGLSAVGNTYSKASASNCYVVRPPADDMNDIFRVCSDMANIQKFRGGTGVDISSLRPHGATVSNSAKESSGAVSFMDLLSKVTATVGQRGRCIEGSQSVLTMRGTLPICEVTSGDFVWTSTGWVENLSTIDNGIKPVYRVTTSRGNSIVATDNHIFTSSVDGSMVEKPLSDLAIGDLIVMLPGTSVTVPYIQLDTSVTYTPGHDAMNGGNRLNYGICLPSELTEDLAYFLGYSYGDGHVDYDKFGDPYAITLACATAHPKIDAKLTAIMSEVFAGYAPKHHKGDGAVLRLRISSKVVLDFLRKNGLLKQLHHSLIMPEKIKQSSTAVQLAFVSGYFDADGYASGSKKGYVIASVCNPILSEIQAFLMAAGIVSHISVEVSTVATHKDLYSLSITGRTAQSLAVRLLHESIKISDKAFISKRDTVLTPFNAKGLGIATSKYAFVPDNTQHLSCSAYSQLLVLGSVSNQLLVADTISSIEPLAPANVYDLELASHHLFYCQGFNVHNSGATMLSIRSSHPDIERFIEEKQDLDKQAFFDELLDRGININDWKYTAITARLKSTTKANVSIRASDKFMRAVDTDSDYDLWFDFIDSKYPNIRQTVKALGIWNKLVAANVKSAEPGILFWDTIIKQSIPDCYSSGTSTVDGIAYDYNFNTLGVNPCQPETTEFLTQEKGIQQLKDINIGDIVWTGKSWSKMVNKWSTGIKEVIKYTFSNNATLAMTENHRIVSNGQKMEIKDATCIDRQEYVYRSFDGNVSPDALLAGMVLGNGSKQKNGGTCAYLNVGDKDADMESAILPYVTKTIAKGGSHCRLLKLNKDFSDLNLDYAPVWERSISAFWKASSSDTMCKFLRGLYTANGSVLANGSRIALKTSSELLAQDVLTMLESLGIRSYITVNKPTTVKHSNGTYTSKQSYDVNTCNTLVFASLIGFEQEYKMSSINTKKANGSSKKVKIVSSISLGTMEVFDYTVEAIEHTVMQKGFLVSNCAELSLNEDACSIGSLFLSQFVVNPFTAKSYFDYVSFAKVARMAIRIQDNVREYDMDFLPLPGYKASAILGRRIGIGFHGLADTVAALGHKYDSDSAVSMAADISAFLKNTLYSESVVLGKEKGVFPIWNWEKEKNNPYINSLDLDVQHDIERYGRRNIALQTIAPTGSISILSRNCSSGIEPIFKLSYNRAVKRPGSEDTDQFSVYHQAVNDCIAAGGDPSVFVEANDIDWAMRIKMQAAVQANIDHSISSTVNLPAGTTEEVVSNIYMTAWKSGLKGITTYVDGCRTGVLTSKDVTKVVDKKVRLVVRPKTTNVDIFKTKYKEKNYMILVGKSDGIPCEIFGGEELGLSLPTKYKKAELTKKSRGHYTLTVQLSEDPEDILKINNIGNLFPAQDLITLTRMISLSLRNGVSVADITEQLQKSASSLYDAPAVFARVLKQYVSDEDAISKAKSGGKVCPECGTVLGYRRESGCITEVCPACNYVNSKCG